jgi:hypothetical protein
LIATLHDGATRQGGYRSSTPKSKKLTLSHSSPCNMCKLHDDFRFNSQFPFSPVQRNIAPASQQFPPPNPQNISVSLGLLCSYLLPIPHFYKPRDEKMHTRELPPVSWVSYRSTNMNVDCNSFLATICLFCSSENTASYQCASFSQISR